MIDHGYVGDTVDECGDPLFVDEAFQDSAEDLFEDAMEFEVGNGDPDSPALERRGSSFYSVGGDPPMNISLPSSFPNFLSGYVEMPEFSNYSVGFAETLDYIFASASSPTEEFGLTPVNSAPMLTSEEMQKYESMPNEYMPSDHYSLVSDLTWTHYDGSS